MKKLLILLIVVLFFQMFVPFSIFAQRKGKSEPNWISLVEGSDLKYDGNALAKSLKGRYPNKYREVELTNGALLRLNDWDEYLSNYIYSLPIEKRHPVLDGVSRHYHEYDKVEKFIRFMPLKYISGPYALASHVALRGVLKDSIAFAYLVVQYYGASWIFADRLTIVVDDEKIELDSLVFKRDNHGGDVWEYALLSLANIEYRNIAKKISVANEVIIRFHGQYYTDLEVSERMKTDLKAMLGAVYTLNNWQEE